MDTNKMRDISREQFEAWHRSVVNGQPPHEKYNNGDYRNQHVQRYWLGWQASREAVAVELDVPSHWVADYSACGGGLVVFDAETATKVTDPMCSKAPAYTIHALEKAGLKVAP